MPEFIIEQIDDKAFQGTVEGLVDLLRDTVESGAAVGFLPPLSEPAAQDYWQEVQAEIRQGSRVLWVARQDGAVVGAVQLALATRPNGLHRAEVQKLLVHAATRRQGVGQKLMTELESWARRNGRSLLVLDTRQGDLAEPLYRKIGYVEAGSIPYFARSADGTLHATVLFYRWLG